MPVHSHTGLKGIWWSCPRVKFCAFLQTQRSDIKSYSTSAWKCNIYVLKEILLTIIILCVGIVVKYNTVVNRRYPCIFLTNLYKYLVRHTYVCVRLCARKYMCINTLISACNMYTLCIISTLVYYRPHFQHVWYRNTCHLIPFRHLYKCVICSIPRIFYTIYVCKPSLCAHCRSAPHIYKLNVSNNMGVYVSDRSYAYGWFLNRRGL